ncbi:Sister chromatid cohesion protein PDS5 B [Phytophthora citrophthora]|uniref:Sister chromatid cohesion protein PDS5 B n=1 Tax=Phytophthora citrophthora TaxID=4793 RepID=A0AAD9G8T6_9STRA|nr:Sister chromatid cohesion protein PDS5 B [Phytophthora citrophthora]
MAPRKTRSSTAAQRRAASKKVPPTRALRHEAVEEEFKAEDPDPNHVLTQQLENQTPRKPQSRQNRTNTPESDTILSGTYLSGAGRNSSALSKRLKETWQELQQTPSRQQQREDGVVDANMTQKLHIVAAELLQEKLLKHHDKNVRSLVACCLVELARVSAPDSPFSSNEELYRVFQLFIEQLRALSPEQTTTSRYLHHFHVLESLATVKSCLLVVGLDFTVEEEEDVVMVQLFEALFETFGENHSAKIENLMLSIMVACIEESDAVDLSLLDVILKPLVDAVNTDEPNGVEVDTDNSVKRNSAHMARELIRRTSDLLQNPLSNFFNNILIDGSSSLGSQQSSELKEHVHTLIYEVHKINPSLLLYVLPNVCLQLQVDEVATRSDAITLMGKLFASSHADYGHQYMKNFRDFLGRFRDASKEIRLQMIQVTVSVWENKPDMAEMLEKEFILRLSDPEWEVRQLVVRELCDFAANCLDLISEECLRAVGERMKDKKVTLRKETMTGLSQVFSAHISTYWEENEDEKRPLSLNHRNIPAAHIKKLGWIPDYVLKCYAYPQQELKLRVIQLLDDFLLPKAFSERARANGLLFLFHSLDATSKEALRRIFNERAKCQDVCKKFVDFKVHNRQKQRATEVDESALDTVKQQLYNGLSPLFSDVSGLNKLLEKLSKWKDHSVFKHLGELCDYSKSQQDARQARDQLVRSVGSKTPLGEFLKKLCRKLSLLTMNQASSAVLLDFLVLKEGRPSRENRSIVDLLVMASGELPELIAPFICDKITAILVGSTDDQDANVSVTSDEEDEEEPMRKDPRVILGTLHVLANYSRYWAIRNSLNGDAAEGNVPSANLVEKLHNFCLGGTDVEAQNFNAAKESRAAELAAFTLAHFYGKLEETTQLVRQLCSKDKLGSPKTSGALPALQSLEMFTKRCSQIFSEDESLFSRLWTHLLEDLIGKGEESLTPGTPASKERTPRGSRPVTAKLAEVRCLAIKIAVNLLVYCQSTRGSPDSQGHGTRLIKLLFGILRSGGNTFGSTPALAASFRTAASCGLMKIIRKRQFEALVSVPEWHLLGLTMQDSSEDVRRKFLKKLTSHLMKQSVQHPHKFLSYLALAATDASTSLKKDARNLLKVAVERMRRVFDAASSRESEELRSPGTPARSALMVPEYALPYVIHLVAHHPQFPVKLVERTPTVMVLRSALWSDQLAYLNFFLDGLVSANSSAADNIAFLLQILTKLSQCHDVEAPGDINIYPLIDSAAVLLKKKIKKQSNLQPFPGKIFLPKHLYRPGRPSTLATPGGRKEPESQESLGATAVRGPRIAVRTSLVHVCLVDI